MTQKWHPLVVYMLLLSPIIDAFFSCLGLADCFDDVYNHCDARCWNKER